MAVYLDYMISKYNHKELNWVDLESPKEEEIEHILDQYPIPKDIKDSILSRNTNDVINLSYDFIYISILNKIIFVVNDNFVITIHDDPLEAFDKFSKEMELDLYGEGKMNNHKLLFAHLLKNLYINLKNKQKLDEKEINELKKEIEGNNKINNKKNRRNIIFIIILIISLILSIWL